MVTAGGDTLGPFTFSLFHFLARILLLSKLGLTFSIVSPREVTPSLGHSQALTARLKLLVPVLPGTPHQEPAAVGSCRHHSCHR